MHEAWSRGVVVGVDGSPEASHAFDWAVAAADRHHAQLRAVHARRTPVGQVVPRPARDPVRADDASSADAESDAVLRRALGRACPRPDGARAIEATTSVGPAVEVLVELSYDADLVVVGRRGSGGGRLEPGSVSAATAARACGPVAVVPTTARGLAPDRIVVGVGLDDDPTPALEIAFAEGRSCARPVELVYAIDAATRSARRPGSDGETDFRAELKGMISCRSSVYPDVVCYAVARPGAPSAVLLGQVTPFDLLILGGRRNPCAPGQQHGALLETVLADAPCVVVVVHATEPAGSVAEAGSLEGRTRHERSTATR